MIIDFQYFFVFLFILIAALLFSVPLFSYLDEEDDQSRNHAMDSLRGFLAIFVIFTHTVAMFYLFKEDSWKNPNIKIGYLAGVGVSLFFMLTGYLFWLKLKYSENLNWYKLYVKRILRIVPLIYFQTIACIITILIITDFNFGLKSIYKTFMEALPWFDFLNNNKTPINGYKNSYYLTGGVLWTIVYEWGFYFSLPLLYLFRKKSKEFVFGLCFLIVYTNAIFEFREELKFIFLFVLGMLCVEIKDYLKLKKLYLELLLLIAIFSVLIFKPDQKVNSYLNLFFVIITVCIINGADLFGILKNTGLRRLGKISYSIYIMHPIILFISYMIMQKYNLLFAANIYLFYLPLTIILLISSLTYKWIEIPFMKIKK
ncbi:acyltransferase family protein [Chryseobacterium sp. GP-SGM7]|uniref:acyltransferase family protein n=1 Tax=Chryseobacterium sp. GP-SGM7 TaxID=3411323 RepID=UPI003B9533ED